MTALDLIPRDDRGLLLGDGLFETMLAVDGVIAHLAAHLDRMSAGCLSLGLAFDRDAAEQAARALRIPVILIDRPPRPKTDTAATPDQALDWCHRTDLGV